jgi:hypothetical protein
MDSFVTDESDGYGNPIEEPTLNSFLMEWIDSIGIFYQKINNYSRRPSPITAFEMQTRIDMEYDSTYHFLKAISMSGR